MVPQTRTSLRRDRTPNRKYIENNLYEIHKRLKQNENKVILKNNSVRKLPKSSENDSSSKIIKKKKKKNVKHVSNGFKLAPPKSNFKLAPPNFITNIQRAQKSADLQRAKNQNPELDSNQNIVDQLIFPRRKESYSFPAKKNDRRKLNMSSNVLSALGLVPSEKM